MFKATPNPPDSAPASSIDSKKTQEADRSLDDLKPFASSASSIPRQPSTIFMIAPDIDTETLLAHACESLASASVMASDFATRLEGPHRNTMLALQQVIMLGELAVSRALDNIDPQELTA